jgi:uncharacterized protein
MNTVERRFVGTQELRAVMSGSKRVLSGYAATFNKPFSKIMQRQLGFIETCAPGCFSRAIREQQDVICTQDHKPELLMGRTKNKTLSLREDGKGLFFECELPDTTAARDLHTLVQRGDIAGCSFGFAVGNTGQKWGKDSSGALTRQLRDIDTLIDVSAVTMPAYDDTEVASRGDKECDDEGEDCDERMIAAFFPGGIPAEIRSHVPNIAKEFSFNYNTEVWMANARVQLALADNDL